MMLLRPFRPGLAPVPTDDSRWVNGTRYEPGHRQRVRAYLEPDQAWFDCAYNRETRRFWVLWRGAWQEQQHDAVRWWTLMPPVPRRDPDALRVAIERERYSDREVARCA
ncbi:MAG: hypothetical protein AAFX50_10020 [Acidobacteriota bacterium]